jgi:hypothetical protein
VSRRPARSRIDVRYIDGRWWVVETLTAEDARAVADALGPHDGAAQELYRAALEVDQANEGDDR